MIGAAFGAGFAYFTGGNVWAGAISGCVGGAVFGATFNPLLARATAIGVGAASAHTLATFGAGAASGFASGLTNEGFSVANGNNFTANNVMESTAAGAFLAHMGGRVASGAASQAARNLLRKNPNGKVPCKNLDNAGAQEPYPTPPGHTSDWTWGPPTGAKVGGWRWFDPHGGEWRYHAVDKWHPTPHWDYNPWTEYNSPWQNVFPAKNYFGGGTAITPPVGPTGN